MAAVGKTNDPVKLQKTMAQFAMENEKMNMTSEIMDDALDDALDDEEMEGEADDVVQQVLDEIGIDITAVNAPRTKVQHAQKHTEAQNDEDLTDRLTALR
jgi:division protein CdvB (Snf7/Vps24/ESCRT-III family)